MNEPVCIADEVPFEIPEGWEWCRLNDIVIKDIKRGKSPKYTDKSSVFVFAQKCNVKTGGIDISLAKYLDMNAFAKYPEEEYMIDKDIVVNSTGNGTLGRIGIFRDSDRLNDNIIVPDSHVTVIRSNSEVCCDYVLCVLEYYQPSLEKQGEGSTNQTELKPGVLADLYFPLPPYEEQKRIVHSLIVLKEYIEKYKLKENKLTQLNTEFPSLLKKSILQQAVMGKLVSQDPNDEPASVLLEKIRSEKEVLIKAGKLKKDKHESIIYRRDNSHYEKRDGQEICIDDEIPFEIPNTWEWSRASSIGSMVRGKGIKRTETVPKGVPCVRYGEIYTSYNVSFSDTISFIEKSLDKNCLHFSTRDIIFTLTGENKVDIAKAVAYLGDEKIAAGGDLAYWTAHGMNPLYLVYYMASPYCIERKRRTATGDIIVHISTDKVGSFLVPVPPLNEQDRIVKAISRAFSKVSAL